MIAAAFFCSAVDATAQVSPNTVTAYRDTFRLLLTFADQRLGKSPCDLTMDDLNAALVLDFLHYLEAERHNSVRSRNARFAAIRSFIAYIALNCF